MREFPDDEACLQWLWRTRHAPDGMRAECPKCERSRPFHRVSGRPAWDCDYCGYHLHPTAGTIFHKSSTSLQLWFYAMFLMSQTRCGVSAKTLEREIGVTYKTAWRMMNLIRNQLMDEESDVPLSGDVEVDETYHGGKPRAKALREGTANRDKTNRAVVFRASAHPPQGAHLRRWRLAHSDHRRVLWTRQERHPGHLSRGLAQVATGLLERVRMALQPPPRPPRDVPVADPRGRA